MSFSLLNLSLAFSHYHGDANTMDLDSEYLSPTLQVLISRRVGQNVKSRISGVRANSIKSIELEKITPLSPCHRKTKQLVAGASHQLFLQM